MAPRSLDEIYDLEKDNNRMLHAMRRSAFIWGMIKLIFYVLILVVAPLYIYSTWVQPFLDNASQTFHQVQGTGTSIQLQVDQVAALWNKFVSSLPSFMRPQQ